MPEPSKHKRVAAARRAHRTNQRGWVIYRGPRTGLWQTRSEADRPGKPGRSQAGFL